jgi:hypothetical protein
LTSPPRHSLAVDEPHQRPSHRRLLDRDVEPTGTATIDGIVVPAARAAAGLEPAFRLAAQLGAPVVVLCSYAAVAAKVRAAARDVAGVTPVDVTGPGILPRLLTTALLVGTPFSRRTDTPVKRNLGLALIHMLGWERVLFLDDDIDDVEPGTVVQAASLLGDYAVVGLENSGFPDNSVVCHANRDTGAHQSTFIGAGAMLSSGSRTTSFFPDIYNEDWFFLLEGTGITRCAMHGKFAQAPFDPYKNPSRAGSEEFGDCLAEGIFALLDVGLTVRDADRQFWGGFLADRAALIEDILRRLPRAEMSPFRREQIAASLRAARSNLLRITPKTCVDYLAAWRHDRDRWGDFIEGLPQGLPIDRALKELELAP